MRLAKKNIKQKSGFTIIEVVFFLTITAVLIIGFMALIAGRIGVQRYQDATLSFADFLRSVYSQAINVENERSGIIKSQNANCTLAAQKNNTLNNGDSDDSYPGKSDCAIYGKMISFGEDQKKIYVYDVIGRVVDFNNPASGTTTALELANVYADVFSFDADSSNFGGYSLTTAADFYSYTPEWETWLENPDSSKFQGTVLIVRSPASGAVRTFFTKKTFPIQSLINNPAYQNRSAGEVVNIANSISNAKASITDFLALSDSTSNNEETFVMEDVNFCVAVSNLFAGVGNRNNVRLKADGRDSSAVEIVETDNLESGGNVCR